MEDVLLNRLATFTSELNILRNQALDLCSSLNEDKLEIARVTASKLQSILNRLNAELYNYFNISIAPNPDEISSITVVQLQCEETLAELNTKLSSLTSSKSVNKTHDVSSRLPKLNLPEFGGDILEWHSFWDQFCSNIDQKELSEVDKLLYLKASLNGEARRAIEGLQTTNKNYQIAVRTLKERYGRVSQVIDAHHRAIYKVKPAVTTTECREVLDTIERHLRVLNSLGEEEGNHLRFLIMEKFPQDVIYELMIKNNTESIADIRRELEKIISARENANRIHTNKTSDNPTYTVETLHTQHKQKVFRRQYRHEFPDNKRRRIMCIFCEGAHFSDMCDKVTSIESRKMKIRRRCFGCLREGHSVANCQSKSTCFYCKRNGHHRALCPTRTPKKDTESTSILHVNEKGFTVLQTAIVTARGQNANLQKCRILLDSGSQRSYVTRQVARDLKLPVEENNRLAVFTFGSRSPKELDSPLVKLTLETQTKKTVVLFANVVPTISHGVPYPKQKMEITNISNEHILADDGSLSDRVDILIGNDYYYSLMSTGKIQLKENLYLIQSELGWILSGKLAQAHDEPLSVLTYFQSSGEMKLNEPDLPLNNGNLKVLWDLESIGIIDSPKANRDEEAIKHFNESMKWEGNRYCVSWPWNEYPPNLPSNFGLAYGRLVSLLKRMDSSDLLEYERTLRDQLEKGVIEVVPNKDKVNHPVHYLPHHGVTTPGKPVRIVYDASAKAKENKSLNQCLYCGPLMLEDLTGLLIKFRFHPIGISADIEKAFLQIALQDKDRDVTRFLWLKDTTKAATDDNLLHLRFTRVPFGIISSPFLLNATIKHHLQKSQDSVNRQIANDMYVDNVVTGTNTTKEAIALYEKSKATFQQISMNLRDWSSNSKEFMQHIPDTCKDKTVKILGLDWHLEHDTLSLRHKDIDTANTKRGILKAIASVYDPCGFTVPFLLPAKLLLQELWKINLKWDTLLTNDMSNRWKDIKGKLNEIKRITVPRRYTEGSQNPDWQLHCFTDASTQAYAAVVYLVGNNNTSFVIGKSRLVPLKDQANLKIPRLELLGVLIGSRLIKYVVQYLEVKSQTLWTDSQIVIDWYHSDKLLTPFVSRRIEEVKKNNELVVRYVPTELNPADIATRPNSTVEWRKWLSGPSFLLQCPDEWPSRPAIAVSMSAGEGLPTNLAEASRDKPNLKNMNETSIIPTPTISHGGNLTTTTQQIIKLQLEHYPEEVNGKPTSLTLNLGLFKDIDGVLRCKGRLKNTDWTFDKKYPVLLPKDSEFTDKIIKDTHLKNYHVGANHTLSLIREHYWIPQGKSRVQRILRKCPSCVKHGGGPFKLPPTPALPPERVNFSMPFTFTGLDYLGPVLVNENGTSKRWICLFTCLAVRAIHLEVVKNLTAEEGLLALRRMISTRGLPTFITSDNAQQFKLIAEILANPYCVESQIHWKFIPELAPWFGGFYERLVGMTKHCMTRTLQKHLLKDSELTTVVKEIEAVLNSRPLTSIDSDLDNTLKPSDFLNFGRHITMETVQEESLIQGTVTKIDLVKSWKKGRVILDEFQEMFRNRYLPSLRERYSHSHKEPRVTSKETPRVGQIVQIKGDKNREGWKVGRITALVKSADSLCRVAKVKVGNTEFNRSISHLYPLEMDEETPYPDLYGQSLVNVPERGRMEHDDESNEDIERANVSNDIADENIDNKIEEHTEMSKESTGITSENIEHIDDNTVTSLENTAEGPQKRRAAAIARQKIREWTRNLISPL